MRMPLAEREIIRVILNHFKPDSSLKFLNEKSHFGASCNKNTSMVYFWRLRYSCFLNLSFVKKKHPISRLIFLKISKLISEVSAINQSPSQSHYPILHLQVGMGYDSLNAITRTYTVTIIRWLKKCIFFGACHLASLFS